MASPNHLLIDGDILLYQATQACLQEVEWDEKYVTVYLDKGELNMLIADMIGRYCGRFKTESFTICLSDYNRPFRKVLDPTYKAHREGTKKPLGYGYSVEMVEQTYPFARLPQLEADDVMGIMATNGGIKKPVIVSDDKDMRQIPGVLHIPRKNETLRISEEEAYRFHMQQTLEGDRADNYPGCPGIGAKRAEKALDGVTPHLWWTTVVHQYRRAGLTSDDAVHQARLAKILQADDWDHEQEQVILWTEPYSVSGADTTSAPIKSASALSSVKVAPGRRSQQTSTQSLTSKSSLRTR